MAIHPEIFAQQMGLLTDRIGRPLAPPTFRAYHQALSEALTTEQFVAATTLAFRTWDAEFRNWPSPKQLIELVVPQAAPSLTALEAFEAVLSAAGNRYVPSDERKAKVQALGAAAVRAFHAAGGIREFQDVLEADLPWLRKRFVEAYEDACAHAESAQAAQLALGEAEGRVQQLVRGIASAKAIGAGPQKQITTPTSQRS